MLFKRLIQTIRFAAEGCMKPCLFCELHGPLTTKEHTVPEALGNDDSVLVGEVCDACQAYLGKDGSKCLCYGSLRLVRCEFS